MKLYSVIVFLSVASCSMGESAPGVDAMPVSNLADQLIMGDPPIPEGAPVIAWECVSRCYLPGSPWEHQNRREVVDAYTVRLWRTTDPHGGYLVQLIGGTWRATVDGMSYSWTFGPDKLSGCVSWAGLPLTTVPGLLNVWCFS